MVRVIKYYFRQSWLLLVSALVFGCMLAGFETAWSEDIAKNEQEKFVSKAQLLLPGAESFETIDTIAIHTPKGIINTDIKRATDKNENLIGWAFTCEGSGFADKIKLIVAVDATFETVAGFGVLFSNETPKLGSKIAEPFFLNQFKGIPVDQITLSLTGDDKKIDSEIIAIARATISSGAVVDIFNNFLPEIKNQLQAKGTI